MRHGHHSRCADHGRSVVNEFDDLIIVAIKEAEHRYEITGTAQGITRELEVEEWQQDRSYIETIGVNRTAKIMASAMKLDGII